MLELKNITKTFGGIVANKDVSIKIEKGTIHAIVGENGAGKSTVMRIAYGFYTADSGEITIGGKVVQIKNPHDAIALGIGMVHQHFMLVETMTVAENIILGAETGGAANLDLDRANKEITALSDKLKLNVNPKALIEDLSVGAQQKVELLKALYRQAELLILDEPTAVLTPQEVEEFFGILRKMREQGKTIVIITHKLEEVLAISDFVTVMRDGKVVGNVVTSETNAKDLAKMIVGRDVLLRVEKTDAHPKETILKVENLSVKSKHGAALKNVSFDVRAGEIVGIAGIEGNGQTELIEAIAGLIPTNSGAIEFLGRDISKIPVRRRTEMGIAHIPEDRQKRGLLLDSDLEENAILGVHYRAPVASGGFLNAAAIETRTNFCDLGGNNYVVDAQLALDDAAKNAGINIIPDCGLAPGMVSVLAMHGANRFEEIEEIHIRVGGLPQNSQPPLNYQLVFSVEGLINEYIETARVIRGSEIVEVDSMTELETLEFENFPALEAFQTSGGTSTLPDTFFGKIKELDYKTIRYAGHCDKFKTLIDLGLCSSDEIVVDNMKIKPRRVLGELLQKNLPADEPDYVLIRLEFVGAKDGERKRLRYDIVDKYDAATGLSAMMRTTAFPASIIAQMAVRGDVKMRGATPQEKAIDADKFVAELARRNIKIVESEMTN